MKRNLMYRKLLESIVLYNQYKNNLKYADAIDFGRRLVKINDFLLRQKIKKNENIIADLDKFENELKGKSN